MTKALMAAQSTAALTSRKQRRDVPQDTGWIVCPDCQGMIYAKRLVRSLRVCPDCGSHHRLTAHQRIEQLFDGGHAELLDMPVHSGDPLGFTDSEPYPERLDRARAATGLDEGVIVATGTIEGNPLVAAVMDFRFLGGSLGAATGELITLAAEYALVTRLPLLIVSASGGARMQEGAIALMQMAKTSQALGRLDEAGILTISLITDPTYGGVAASFSTLCDVIIGEPGARLGFAGPRVIEQTIRQKLPEGFQTAEFLLERGFIDTIRPRSALRATLARLLSVGGRTTGPPPVATGSGGAGSGGAGSGGAGAGSAGAGSAGADVVVRDPDRLGAVDPWQAVQQARQLDRPTTLDYLGHAFDDFEELHGDRLGGDCAAVVGGPARLGDQGVMVIGQQKGQTVAELTARNYGMATPAGYRKAARLMRLAAKLGLPVITFVDTPGAYPGPAAEEQGQAVAIAENIRLMAALPVPVLTLVTGEGGSGGALALAVANQVLICSRAVYSVISPEGCAAILWNDPAKAPDAAAALRVDARQLLRLGIVDGVVPEPEGGNQADHVEAARRVRAALLTTLRSVSGLDGAELVARRRERFRAFGNPDGRVVTGAVPRGEPR